MKHQYDVSIFSHKTGFKIKYQSENKFFFKGAFWSKTRTIVTTTFKIHKKFKI